MTVRAVRAVQGDGARPLRAFARGRRSSNTWRHGLPDGPQAGPFAQPPTDVLDSEPDTADGVGAGRARSRTGVGRVHRSLRVEPGFVPGRHAGDEGHLPPGAAAPGFRVAGRLCGVGGRTGWRHEHIHLRRRPRSPGPVRVAERPHTAVGRRGRPPPRTGSRGDRRADAGLGTGGAVSEQAGRCPTYGEQCAPGPPGWLFAWSAGVGAVVLLVAEAARPCGYGGRHSPSSSSRRAPRCSSSSATRDRPCGPTSGDAP